MTIPDMHERPDWHLDALCAQTDPEAFFPDKGGSTLPAKRVCLACPVRDACLQEALESRDEFGVRGGLSARERRHMLPAEPAGPGKPRVDLTPEQERIVVALLSSGASLHRIGRETGAGQRAIDRFIAKLNKNGAAA